jgi:hypothetical protein
MSVVHIPTPSLIMNTSNKQFPFTDNILRVQLICVANGVDTSVDYASARRVPQLQKLPEDPRPAGVSWYDYLHPDSAPSERIPASDFVKGVLVPNNLLLDRVYEGWLNTQTANIADTIPSVQHIADGFFGKSGAHSTFRVLLNSFHPPKHGHSMR